MKKYLFILPLILLILLGGLFAGWLYLRSLLNEAFLVRQIEAALNARVEIRKLDIDLFSAISSIELEGVRLGARDAVANKGTPLADRAPMATPLIAAESVELELSFLPLLSRRFEIKRFVIDRPEIKLVHYPSGANNLSGLFGPPQIVEGQPNPALKKTPEPPAAEEPGEPFSVKNLPVSAGLERVGIENGVVHVSIPAAGHRILVENLNVSLTDFDVDPADLAQHNRALLAFHANTRVFGTSGKEAGLLLLRSEGHLQLFDPNTGQVNPDLVYALRMLRGSYISDLTVMEQLSGRLPLLASAGIALKGVGERAELTQDVDLRVRYRAGQVTLLSDVNFPTVNYDLTLKQSSWLLISATAHQFQGRILASEAESARAIQSVDGVIARNLKDEDPVRYRKLLLGELLLNDRIVLDFISTGPLAQPQVYLKTQIPSLTDILKDSAKTLLKNRIENRLREELNQGQGKAIQEGLDKLLRR